MQLVPTPNNPIPAEPNLVGVRTKDGLNLRAAWWMPATAKPRGTVCILQGRAEFVEKYFEVIGELLERDFAVVAFDWRGQGLSDRQVRNPRKGYVRSFADYRHDLEAVRDQVLLPLMPEPHFGLAHSMGGAIALSAAHESWLPFRRLVTTTPMIALGMIRTLRTAAVLMRILRWLGLGKAFVPGGGETSISTMPFKGNRLTGDPARYARNAEAATALGAGAIGAPTVAWLDSAFRFMKRFTDPAYALRIRLPTLILAAGADPVCATPATERFASRLKAGHAIVIPGARHEILMERDSIREQFWAAFDAFVPGSPNPLAEEPAADDAEGDEAEAASAAEELDGGRVDAPVAGRDDAPALSG
ncbi:alpha/beta fold hydrolase [Microvirga thermotolerans]|uniref:Alpha/beta fold hydrolase n=1 Tax=Microvirga thermotolerans TaxID=2651334 RepID=A0A5P9JUU6_9HYPH|nr:alpha/beta hydrolase [Microvirga thermotolerans]QFU15416.1 alpha/beta fold hydrolase [Microvirga thermotolerans]